MPFVTFRKKFRFFSFDFRQNFNVRTFPRWLSICGTKFFLRDIQKFYFSKSSLSSYYIDRFLDGFSKFWFFIGEICLLIRDFWVILENYSMCMLSIRGTDFIACWANEERISAHAQPAVKYEHFYMYSPCWAYAERILSHTEHTGNSFHRMLSIQGTDFIACWACAEMFKSRISRPNWIPFFKNLVLQALGTIRFRFLQKKSKKNFMLVYL
jgi:hypothetical protein